MRRWVCVFLAVAAMMGAAGACSSFEASEPGPGEDAGTAEGGDVTSPDPAADGAVPDGRASDGGWVPCAQRAVDPSHFCDDFDLTGRVDLKWSSGVGDGGTIDETDAALSLPRALVLRLLGDSGQTKALLRSNRGGQVDVAAKNHLVVSFSMRVDKAPYPVNDGSGFMHVALIELDSPTCDSTAAGMKQRDIELSFYASGSFGGALKGLRDLCPTDAGDFLSLPTTYTVADFEQNFRRVTLDVSRTPCAGSTGVAVRLSVEGAAESSCASLGTGDPFTHGAALTMQLGLVSSGKWAETAIAYDDVTVDFD